VLAVATGRFSEDELSRSGADQVLASLAGPGVADLLLGPGTP
jgi:hypothetical protein